LEFGYYKSAEAIGNSNTSICVVKKIATKVVAPLAGYPIERRQEMVTKETTEQVLWMADCYSLAKRFPNPHTWLSLLEPVEPEDAKSLNPFHYWLWMEIWKAAQMQEPEQKKKTH